MDDHQLPHERRIVLPNYYPRGRMSAAKVWRLSLITAKTLSGSLTNNRPADHLERTGLCWFRLIPCTYFSTHPYLLSRWSCAWASLISLWTHHSHSWRHPPPFFYEEAAQCDTLEWFWPGKAVAYYVRGLTFVRVFRLDSSSGAHSDVERGEARQRHPRWPGSTCANMRRDQQAGHWWKKLPGPLD